MLLQVNTEVDNEACALRMISEIFLNKNVNEKSEGWRITRAKTDKKEKIKKAENCENCAEQESSGWFDADSHGQRADRW